MQLCQVIGTVVATAKSEDLRGAKLLLVQPRQPDGTLAGEVFVATDTIGAGTGEIVLVARGGAARQASPTSAMPTDAAVVAIVDTIEIARGTAAN